MLKNLVQSERKEEIHFNLEFGDSEGNGYSFPCDRAGNVFPLEYQCARDNLKYCLDHPEEFEVWNKVRREVRKYTEPAHGTCFCGREVYLWDQYYGACECECGKWYNLFGQELLPPEQWESDPAEEEYW